MDKNLRKAADVRNLETTPDLIVAGGLGMLIVALEVEVALGVGVALGVEVLVALGVEVVLGVKVALAAGEANLGVRHVDASAREHKQLNIELPHEHNIVLHR